MSELRTRSFRGDKLRDTRKAKNWSQSKLARKIGAHVTSVSDWERGANAPSGRHVASLSRELGVKAESFYSDDDEEESHPVVYADFMRALMAVVEHTVNKTAVKS